jgi:hypothetical protein
MLVMMINQSYIQTMLVMMINQAYIQIMLVNHSGIIYIWK